MTVIRYTRNLFLRGISVVFLFAFTSFYIQIPGLYGRNGILPAYTQFEKPHADMRINLQSKPTLLWFAPALGIDVEHMLEILSVVGILLSFTGFVSQKCCCKPVFAALWSLYYSLFQVGQTFMWYQWDVLLLEAGFLSILVAPFWYGKVSRKARNVQSAPSDFVSFWLVRWLLFRLVFSAGAIKLASGCPLWWSLDALSVHFESMVLPTPLSWYAHYLPRWFLRLTTAFALVSELAIPPLFFFPSRLVQTVAFYVQIFLQLNIFLTGNFNFFNILITVLCLSLLSDSFFFGSIPTKGSKGDSTLKTILSILISLGVYGTLLYSAYILFSLKVLPSGAIEAKIAFSKNMFDTAMSYAMPGFAILGAVSLSFTALYALYSSLQNKNGQKSTFSTIFSFISTLVYVLIAAFVFSVSLVPFSTIHPAGKQIALPLLQQFNESVSNLHIANSYGLFRHMTGVGGRPEVIIEGSDNMKDGPWKEYNFLYKPGSVSKSLSFVAPYQPRLDWQMWFAALGTYHQNPWLVSFVYRLLTNEPDVLKLIDNSHNPFPSAPPKFIRGSLYKYSYTPHDTKTSDWWTRKREGEYLPVFSKDHPPLLEYLRAQNILTSSKPKSITHPTVKEVLEKTRTIITAVEPYVLMWSLITAAFAIIFLTTPSQSGPFKPKKSK
nr:PREDICTED: lipase maturation factor 2-like [Bemisia tabaci]